MRIIRTYGSFACFMLLNVLRCDGELPPSSYGPPSKNKPSSSYGPPPNMGSNSRLGNSPSSSYGPPPSPDIKPPAASAFGKTSSPGQNPSSSESENPNSGNEDAKPEPFSFMYEVKDAATGNDFSHRQESDGKTVKGEYKVLLPDGRNQVVTYTADDGGYNAEVKYDGEVEPSTGSGGPTTNGGSPGGLGTNGGGGSSGYPSGGPKKGPGLELPPRNPNSGGGLAGPPPSGNSFAGYPSGSPTGVPSSGLPQNSYLPPNFSGY